MRSALRAGDFIDGRRQTNGKSVFSGEEKQENADFTLQMIFVRAACGESARFNGLYGTPEGVHFL
jgi:hypothetical protein